MTTVSHPTIRHGYRGYIFSRPFDGTRVPQHVQNLVIRDYARRRGLEFRLSATELAVPGCHMMLESVLDDLDEIEGIILYSLFMLPSDARKRLTIYERMFDAGATLHAAVENYEIPTTAAAARVEEIWRLRAATTTPVFAE